MNDAPEEKQQAPETADAGGHAMQEPPWRDWLWAAAAILLTLCAFTMRTKMLGARPWEEYEALEVYLAQGKGLAILFQHPPMTLLQTIFLYVWGWFSQSHYWLRLPYAAMGAATVWLTYVAGRRFYFQGAGLLAAALTAFSYVHIFHSQEVNSHIAGPLVLLVMLLVYDAARKNPSAEGMKKFFFAGAVSTALYMPAVFPWLALYAHFLRYSARSPRWAEAGAARREILSWMKPRVWILLGAVVALYILPGRFMSESLTINSFKGHKGYFLLVLPSFIASGDLASPMPLLAVFTPLYLKGVLSSCVGNRNARLLFLLLPVCYAGLFFSLFLVDEGFLLYDYLIFLPLAFLPLAGGLGHWPALGFLYRKAVKASIWLLALAMPLLIGLIAFLWNLSALFPGLELHTPDGQMRPALGISMLLCMAGIVALPPLMYLKKLRESAPGADRRIGAAAAAILLVAAFLANEAKLQKPIALLAASPLKFHGQQDWEQAAAWLAKNIGKTDVIRFTDDRSRLSFFSQLPKIAKARPGMTLVANGSQPAKGGWPATRVAEKLLNEKRLSVAEVRGDPPSPLPGRIWDVFPVLSFLTDPKLLGFYDEGLNARFGGDETQNAFRAMFGQYLNIKEFSGIVVYNEKDGRPEVDIQRLMRQFLQYMQVDAGAPAVKGAAFDAEARRQSRIASRALLAMMLEPAISNLGLAEAFQEEAVKVIEAGSEPYELHLLLMVLNARQQKVGIAVRHGNIVKSMTNEELAQNIVNDLLGTLTNISAVAAYDPIRDVKSRRQWLLRLCQAYAPWLESDEGGLLGGIDKAWAERNFKEADSLTRDLLKENPESPGGLWRMANLHLMAGKERAADATLKKVLPQDMDSYAHRALKLMLDAHRRKFDEAAIDAQALVELEPDKPLGELALAALRSGKKRNIIDAERIGPLAEKYAGGDAVAAMLLADAVIADDDIKLAQSVAGRTPADGENQWAAGLAAAHLAEAEGANEAEARKRYDEIVQEWPNNFQVQLDAVNFYLANNQDDRAEAILESLLKTAPDSYMAILYLAALRLRDSRYSVAVDLAQKILEVYDTSYYGHLIMGQSYMIAGLKLEARGSFDRCLKIEPDNPLAQNKMKLLEKR